jgi:hypothetical protein
MARNRMIKPEFFEDVKLSGVSLESNLVYIGLWVYSDDYGVHDYSLRNILGELFRHRSEISEKKLEKWIKELINENFLIHAEVKLRPILVIRSWDKHQNVPNPSKRRVIEDQELTEIFQLYYDNYTEDKHYVESNESLIRVYFYKEKEERERVRERRKRKDSTTSFVVPSVSEIEEYCKERGNKIDAEKFFNHYQARGWTWGKQNVPMKDWKAAVRTWEINDKEFTNNKQSGNRVVSKQDLEEGIFSLRGKLQ